MDKINYKVPQLFVFLDSENDWFYILHPDGACEQLRLTPRNTNYYNNFITTGHYKTMKDYLRAHARMAKSRGLFFLIPLGDA